MRSRRMLLAARCAVGLTLTALVPRTLDAQQGATRNYSSAHFTFTMYDGLAADLAAPLAEALENNYRRILDDLAVTSIPRVTVDVFGDYNHYLDATEAVFGQRLVGSYGSVHHDHIFLAASATASLTMIVVHEFAHVVTNHVKSNAGNNPRWLWESVAIYEAGDFHHPRTLSFLRGGTPPPSLAQLDVPRGVQLYEIGYVLAEFIVQTWGRPKLVDLIKTNANFSRSLGLNQAAFETRFAAYVRDTYFVKPDEVFLTNTAEVEARSVLNPVTAPGAWELQVSAGAEATMTVEGDTVVFRTTMTTGTGWHVQALQTGIDLEEGASYLLHFQMKSASPTWIQIYAAINAPDWTNVGLVENVVAGPEFTAQTVMFKANHVRPDNNRIGIVLGNNSGMVIVKNFALARMQPPPPLPVVAQPPTDMTVLAGGDAFFSATVTGQYATYQWRRDDVDLPGATAATLFVDGVTAADAGAYSVRVTNGSGTVASTAGNLVVASSGSARLMNLSVRAQVGTGERILIPGFTVSGSGEQSLLVRAVGPRLAGFGVGGTLPDPTLALVPQGTPTVIAANDNWLDAPDPSALEAARMQTGAFSFLDSRSESSLVVALPPGAYTAPTSGVSLGTGIALSEVYAVGASTAQLTNLSARAQVGTGDNVLVPGFVIGGDVAITLLIRAVGPGLADFGVADVLRDPIVTVHRSLPGGGSEEIARNDDWESAPALTPLHQATTKTHAFALTPGSADAAILLALNPGAYTTVVAGAEGGTGVALVELYRVSGE